MKKKLISYILIAAMMLTGFAGCGENAGPDGNGNEEIVPTGELAPVASFYDINLPLYDISLNFEWCGEFFVYLQKEWNKETGYNTCTLYKVTADGSGEATQIHQSTTEEFGIWNYTMDDDGNYYTLSWRRVGEAQEFRLYKYDANMQEIICVEPDKERVSTTELSVIQEMYVDDAGRVILADWDSNVYFFDENLNFLWKETLRADFFELNFVDAGEQGCFFAVYDEWTSRVSLLKIDYERQRTVALPEINMSEYLALDEYLQIVSGGEYGVLLSTNNNLFKYNPDTGEVEPWLDWKDTNMNVSGETVEEIKFHEEGDEVFMSVWCYDWRDDTSEMAEVSYIDKAYLPEKQTVVLGTMVYSDVEKWVDQFNRNNRQYVVEIKEYENSDELVEAFLFGNDEVPDILDISVTSNAMLNNKGILEDLEPYFKASEVINEKDILESIWNMCQEDGKVTSMITQFYFESCVTSLDTISENGWTTDAFFALEKQYPESSPLLYYKYFNVFRMLGDTGYESFIDWDKKKCDFDSKEFISLIEKIKSLNLNPNPVEMLQEEEEIEALLAKDFLLSTDYYRTPYYYRRLFKKYRGCVRNVGFPTSDGEPYYRVHPDMQFSIYSGSEQKDGAWAFIEFMLSEESQTWYGDSTWAFPVRQNAFEEFLTKPQSVVSNYVDDDPNIDTYSVFMNMIEHAHLAENNNLGTISAIIDEELQVYFADAKTAEETAEIIQSRVQLYLDENY